MSYEVGDVLITRSGREWKILELLLDGRARMTKVSNDGRGWRKGETATFYLSLFISKVGPKPLSRFAQFQRRIAA